MHEMPIISHIKRPPQFECQFNWNKWMLLKMLFVVFWCYWLKCKCPFERIHGNFCVFCFVSDAQSAIEIKPTTKTQLSSTRTHCSSRPLAFRAFQYIQYILILFIAHFLLKINSFGFICYFSFWSRINGSK